MIDNHFDFFFWKIKLTFLLPFFFTNYSSDISYESPQNSGSDTISKIPVALFEKFNSYVFPRSLTIVILWCRNNITMLKV